MYDYVVVGAGFFGAVFAQQMKEAGRSVCVIEKRSHIGGNCHSSIDPETNVIVHTYGTHIFHTNQKKIWDYVQRFGTFNTYQHKVLTEHRGRVYPIPINLKTINDYYQVNLRPHEVSAFMSGKKAKIEHPRNFEEKAMQMVGEDLYRAFIRGYTLKQWQQDPKNLPASIINRLPVRNTYNNLYFDDSYQGVPIEGYTPLFENLLNEIPVHCNTDFFSDRDYWRKRCKKLVYTGPIDRYFDYRFGKLNWRSVRFESEKVAVSDFQGIAVMNYADEEIPYTRIHEPKYLHPEREMSSEKTLIIREFSQSDPESPYYPVNTPEDAALYEKYKKLAEQEENVHFGGRLAQYKYFDMHHVIACALALSQRESS